eukprot:2017951-Rhodomonas_salina.1
MSCTVASYPAVLRNPYGMSGTDVALLLQIPAGYEEARQPQVKQPCKCGPKPKVPADALTYTPKSRMKATTTAVICGPERWLLKFDYAVQSRYL